MYKSSYRTVSFTLPWDDVPIDLSYIFADEKPAGKHGFLTVKDGKFAFEDGTPARFWGTNFNSGANFPSHEYSEIVAKRLAKTGLNIVRFHQLDGDWSTPNLFQFTKGKLLKNTRSLDPESMDRLDYLIFALKKNGIYVYFDMLTYRRFREGDGVENTKRLADSARPQSNFDEHLIELQKEFCEQIWTHVNPYTQLAYKDDPVIVMSEIANENEIFAHCEQLVEPYRTRLEEKYQAWRKENGYPPAETPVDFTDNSTLAMFNFKLMIQKSYFDDMQAFMRSIGVKIPITGTNWNSGGGGTLLSQADMTYMDSHTYHYGWKWTPHEKGIMNSSFLSYRSTWIDGFPFMRAADRPFFISEWDDPWPNEYRAEGPLHLASQCALQGWAGAAIHTYRYDCRPNIDMLAAPVTGEALSGVPYRSGIFDAFNDPARYGLFYHAALLLRRGDVKESDVMTVIPYNGPTKANENPANKNSTVNSIPPAFECAAQLSKTAVAIPTTKIPEGANVVDPNTSRLPKDARIIESDTGELCRDLDKRLFIIDSPRTKAVSGFLNAAGEIQLKGLKIKCHNEYAVIALSSLTDAPITESENILLTVVGHADNTGAVYNDNHTIQYDKGHGPIEAEVIAADFELDTTVNAFRVDAINSFGMQVGQTPAEVADGKLRFSTGGDFPSVYYLIQKI